MDIRQITPNYAVSPQIAVEDMPAIAAAGFTKIICNRPDAEIPPSHHATTIADAAEKAGLEFTFIPVTHQDLNMQMVADQKAAIDTSKGPVLAYCASGTRSSIVWSLGQAGEMATDDIIKATAAVGYDLAGLRPRLDALAGNAG